MRKAKSKRPAAPPEERWQDEQPWYSHRDGKKALAQLAVVVIVVALIIGVVALGDALK